MADPALIDSASDFATSLSKTLEIALGPANEPYLKIQASDDHVIVTSQDPKGVLLCVREQPVYRLHINFQCIWNSTKQYLAIHKSTYQIAVDGHPEPVMRFDFVSDAKKVPISHINIHSHHPGLQQAMAKAKPNSRANKAGNDTSRLHIPTGGLRFRPTLEDVLEMLIREFKVDTVNTWAHGLTEGRKEFRNTQLAAAIRDNPDEAVRALSELGYLGSWNDEDAPRPEPRDLKRGVY